MRRTVPAVVLSALILASLSGCASKQANGAASKTFQTVAVQRGNLRVDVAGTGIVQPSVTEELKTTDAGIVEKVSGLVGQSVKKGDTIVQFEGKDLSDKISEQQLQIKKLNLQLDQLDQSLAAENENLAISSPVSGVVVSVNAVSGGAVQLGDPVVSIKDSFGKVHDVKAKSDGNVSEVKVAKGANVTAGERLIQLSSNGKTENQIQSLKLDIESANLSLDDLKNQAVPPSALKAQMDGQITELDVANGDQVKAGDVLAKIADFHQLQIDLAIDELDIPKVKVGQNVKVLVNAFPDKTFKGKVVKIAGEGTPTNGVSTFDVTVSLDNAGDVKPGMSASANIIVTQKKNVLLLPVEALQEKNNQFYVYVQDQNAKRKLVPVQVGVHNENLFEITGGLKEGEKVMVPIYTTQDNQNKKAKIPGVKKLLGGGNAKKRANNKGGKQ